MIQTTAPTPNAGSLQTAAAASHAAPGMPMADFAALLGLGAEFPGAVTPSPTLHTGAVSEDVPAPISLPDALKGTQQGLAALALQAGAALSRPLESAIPTALPVAGQVAQGTAQATTSTTLTPTIQPPVNGSPVPPVAAFVPSTLPDTAAKPTLPSAQPMAAKPTPRPATKPGLPTTAAPETALVSSEMALPSDGKGGKTTGKLLPSVHRPAKHQPDATLAEAGPTVEKAGQVPVAAIASGAAIVDVSVAAVIPPAPIPTVEVKPSGSGEQSLPVPARAQQPAALRNAEPGGPAPISPAVLAQVRAVRFEPIEIVATEVPEAVPALTASHAPTTPASPAASEALPDPATGAPVPTVDLRASQPQAPAVAVGRPVPLPEYDTASGATAPIDRPILPQTPMQPAATRVATETTAPPAHREAAAAPAMPAPTALGISPQSAPADHPPEASAMAADLAPVKRDVRASDPVKVKAEVEAETLPEAGAVAQHPAPRPFAPQIGADGPTAPVANPSDGTSALSPPPAEAPQDFDTLVSRIAEAREAAAPHVVRTAMPHGEFGRVSMQLDHSDGGLSVTLASRDPEFTGAVQAAAAAMASNASAGGDQPRQDGSAAQQNNAQGQAQSGAQANANGGQGQQPRADASGQQSGQQARREGGSFSRQQDQQQPGSPARDRGQQRSGGGSLYA